MIWFCHQVDPLSPVYNVPLGLRIRGDLDLPALQKSLDLVVVRHEALRTTFSAETGNPVQIVGPARPVTLEITDISALPAPECEKALLSVAREEASRPFDLTRDLMLRAKVFRIAERVYALVLTMHHVASDGWSLGVLLRELSAAYAAHHAGISPELPSLTMQYADYAIRQREFVESADWQPLLSFWKERAGQDLDRLHITPDKRRPARQTFRGARESIVLPAAFVAELVKLGQSRKASLFMTLLSAFQVLLHRYSGHDEIAVGFPIAGRNQPETCDSIGFFGNTLISCSDLSENPLFLDFLENVRDSALLAYERQEFPFGKLVQCLQPERNPSKPLLFQTLFVFENGLIPRIAWPGLQVDRFDVHTSTAKFDLSVLIEERDGLEIVLEYNTDLFEPATIRRLLGHYNVLLQALVDNPDRRVGTLPILSPAERMQLLVDWNKTQRPCPQLCVHELFEQQAQKTPEATAVRFDNAQLTYRELNRQADALAVRLRILGVGLGSKVGVLLAERKGHLVVALLAILKAGAAYVPLDPKLPQARLDSMIRQADIRVLLAQAGVRVPPVPVHLFWLDRWQPSDEEKQAEPASCHVNPGDLAYVIFTSGSTGAPKGVAIPHRGIARLIFGQDYIRFGPEQVFLQFAPLGFDLSTLEIWGPLLHGGTCALFGGRALDAQELARALRKYKVTTLWLTASMFNVIIDDAPDVLAPLKQILVGGEALSVPHVRRALKLLPHIQLINGYGPTENTTFTSAYRIPPELPEDICSIPIGRPIANTTVYILDKHLQPVPIGVPGELYTGGAGLALGYLSQPCLSAQKFVANPFEGGDASLLYRTGDIARYLPDGNIEFIGRCDDQVKIRGCRVELGEIEAVLNRHPQVKAAAAMVTQTSGQFPSIICHIVPRDRHDALADELRTFLQAQLPDYMVPAKFVVRPFLPLLPNGKVDRRALVEADASDAASARCLTPPRDTLETELVKIWQKILETRPIGTKDNFFDLGGHSLAVIRLITTIERRFGKRMDVSAFLGAQTVEQLAIYLRNGEATEKRLHNVAR